MAQYCSFNAELQTARVRSAASVSSVLASRFVCDWVVGGAHDSGTENFVASPAVAATDGGC
jgi:hypothetical protein